MPEIAAHELAKLLSSDRLVQVVDLRHAADFNRNHIPRAVSLPAVKGQAPAIADHSKREASFVLYSYAGAGPSTKTIASQLAKQGFDVAVLAGGWEAWLSSGRSPQA